MFFGEKIVQHTKDFIDETKKKNLCTCSPLRNVVLIGSSIEVQHTFCPVLFVLKFMTVVTQNLFLQVPYLVRKSAVCRTHKAGTIVCPNQGQFVEPWQNNAWNTWRGEWKKKIQGIGIPLAGKHIQLHRDDLYTSEHRCEGIAVSTLPNYKLAYDSRPSRHEWTMASTRSLW